MRIDQYRHGVPSWIHLAHPEPGLAARFYTGVFGWELREAGVPGGGQVWCLRGEPVAGLEPADPGAVPAWATYVHVTDVAQVADLAVRNGGAVVRAPAGTAHGGCSALLADPDGGRIGIWQTPADGEHGAARTGIPGAAALVNEPGTLCWNELVSPNPGGAREFYPAVFGWTNNLRGAEYTEWHLAGRPVAGLLPTPAPLAADVPTHWGVYLAVHDVNVTVAQAISLGGVLVAGPMDIKPGRFAALADPGGALFHVIALNR